MSEWILGGWSRAIAQAVRAMDRDLAALQRVDFRKGWPRGIERRRFRRFIPDRVLENLAFALPNDHRLWNSPVVRQLQVLSALYLEETPSKTDLLSALKAVRKGQAAQSAAQGRRRRLDELLATAASQPADNDHWASLSSAGFDDEELSRGPREEVFPLASGSFDARFHEREVRKPG